MPLPAPASDGELLHTRTITCEGYARDDGLWDIDGWITDIKTYDAPNQDRGGVPAGEPLHGMGLRLTIDADMNIHDAVAVTDYSPFRMCPAITPNFNKLIGLNMGKGFRKAAHGVVGGTQGCVHLVDLLGPMATAAHQTLGDIRYKQALDAARSGRAPDTMFLGACHAWRMDGPIVEREFPSLYTGKV